MKKQLMFKKIQDLPIEGEWEDYADIYNQQGMGANNGLVCTQQNIWAAAKYGFKHFSSY